MTTSALWNAAYDHARGLARDEGGPAASGKERLGDSPGCVGHYMIRGLLAVGVINREALGDREIEGYPMPCAAWMTSVFRHALPGMRSQAYWTAKDMVTRNDAGKFEAAWNRLRKAGRRLEAIEQKRRDAEVSELISAFHADDAAETETVRTAPVARRMRRVPAAAATAFAGQPVLVVAG